MHMGNGVVIRAQTTTTPALGLRLKIDAGEATAHSIEIEPAPARQVQEHKAMRFYNNKKSSVGHYLKYSQAHKQNILHI